jgi:hypothetical protein
MNSLSSAAIKYPSDLSTPPHEKWILLEAKTGRHIARDGFVAGEEKEPDRTLASVALYLPTDALKSAMSMSYKDVDLGMAAGKAIESAFQRGGTLRAPTQQGAGGFSVDRLMDAAGGGIAGIIGGKVRGALTDVGNKFGVENAEQVAEIVAGKAVNPRTDTAFDAMQYRTHEFTFNLIPRTKEEADNIDAILNILHFYSLPSYGDSASVLNFMIGFPYEFVITMFSETHINKIERSVLTGLQVDHAGGDRVAFAGNYYPAATTLSLSFKEVRLLGRDSDVIFRGTNRTGIVEDPREPTNLDAPLTEEPAVTQAAPTHRYQDMFEAQKVTTNYQDQFDAQRSLERRLAIERGLQINPQG